MNDLGNTIFLGLGASNQPASKPWGWLKSLVSIVTFFAGAMIFSFVMRSVGALRRGTLMVSFFIQASLIIIAVALIEADLIPHSADDMSLDGGPLFLELIPIGLLAFQSAGAAIFWRLDGLHVEYNTLFASTVSTRLFSARFSIYD